MAMIDYGAIAFRNRKLISTEMFTPMINMVGWEDTDADTYHDYNRDVDEPLRLNGNFSLTLEIMTVPLPFISVVYIS